MRKRAYRSINVKQVDSVKLISEIGNQKISVGVDVAKTSFFAGFMDEEREIHTTVKWQHPVETPLFVELLKHLSESVEVEVIMEPSGTYGDILRDQVIKINIPVFRVSPKRAHDAAEVFDGVPSQHDPKCAAIIAKLHLDGASEPWPFKSDFERKLKAATRTMTLYQEHFRDNVNRLEAELARCWPELPLILKLGSATMLELLIQTGCPNLVASMSEKSFMLMKKVGGSLLDENKIDAVIKSARSTLGVKLIDEEIRALQILASETRRAEKAAQKEKLLVEKMSRSEPSIVEMGKAIGLTTAAVIVSEAGDPTSFKCAAAYEKAMGLNVKINSSGKCKPGRISITKRGSGKCRKYLYLAVLRMIQSVQIVRAWYLKKVERDGGVKMKALIAIMRKLSRALWHLAKGNKFDSKLLFDARRLNITGA